MQSSSARRYETEFARLRWEDEQKRATIYCLSKKNEHLEKQISEFVILVILKKGELVKLNILYRELNYKIKT